MVFHLVCERCGACKDWVRDHHGLGPGLCACGRKIWAVRRPYPRGAVMRDKEYWDRDDVQFPRLLAEIKAAGLTSEQMAALRSSMDLSSSELCELLDRAEETWDAVKVELDFVDVTCVSCRAALPKKPTAPPICGAV